MCRRRCVGICVSVRGWGVYVRIVRGVVSMGSSLSFCVITLRGDSGTLLRLTTHECFNPHSFLDEVLAATESRRLR